MRNKIKEHYKTGFSSSPIEVTNSEIDFIVKNECKCYSCDKSIFEMYDFPELMIKEGELRCEECYDEDYRPICLICEESYDIYKGESEYEVVTEEDSNDYQKEPGIYHNDKLVLPIRINYYKSIDVDDGYCKIYSDKICPECVEKMIRKNNYLKSEGIPCILLKRYENDDLFNDYTPERMRLLRQKLIHQRITCRGLIERGNHIADYGKSGRAKLLKRSSSQNVESKDKYSTCS